MRLCAQGSRGRSGHISSVVSQPQQQQQQPVQTCTLSCQARPPLPCSLPQREKKISMSLKRVSDSTVSVLRNSKLSFYVVYMLILCSKKKKSFPNVRRFTSFRVTPLVPSRPITAGVKLPAVCTLIGKRGDPSMHFVTEERHFLTASKKEKKTGTLKKQKQKKQPRC